jgi:hypothetical protein
MNEHKKLTEILLTDKVRKDLTIALIIMLIILAVLIEERFLS